MKEFEGSILLFEQFHGKSNIGSSRIRGHWLVKYWPEVEIFKIGRKYKKFIIFQKVYWLEYVEMIKKQYPDTILILDMCDADFLHWGYRIKQMTELMDAVTTSTEELHKFMSKITKKPVRWIPDRLDFEMFKQPKKVHKGRAKIAAWYGYSENFKMLDAAVNSLIKYKFEELIVVASKRRPYMLPISVEGKIQLTNYPWTLETVNEDLLRADLVINPVGLQGRFKYKSNNKTIAAWALGLPVAHNEEELKLLMDEADRIKEANKRYEEVRKDYDIKQSVESLKELIKEIQNVKNR
ncbi:MAG: hypothetical protein U1E54_03875 [Candidatus Levybacteria bacterium]|nr:hypothetical protein [Candidatus Levybacteria bacterium]